VSGGKMPLLLFLCSLLAIKNLLNHFILEFRISLFGQISPVGKSLLNVHAPNVNVFQELSKMCFQNPALILAILVLFPNDSNILFSESNFRFLLKSTCA